MDFITTDVGNKGAEGAMFFVKALRDLTVKSFEFYGVSGNTNLVQIYTKTGKYEGFEKSVAGKVAEIKRYFFVIGIFLRIFLRKLN